MSTTAIPYALTDLRRALACIALRWELLLLAAFACAEPGDPPAPRRRLSISSRVVDSSSPTTSSLPTMTQLPARFYNKLLPSLSAEADQINACVASPRWCCLELRFSGTQKRTRSRQAGSSIHVCAAVAVQILQQESNKVTTKPNVIKEIPPRNIFFGSSGSLSQW